MKVRIVDAALLLATIAGGSMAVSSARRLHALQQEHTRLSRTAGEIVITDPAQMHVVALDTGQPLHFAWRVYAPAGKLTVLESTGGRGRSSSTHHDFKPHEFIARIRFTENRADQTAVYSQFHGGASYWSFGSTQMFRFLSEHRNELEIEQLGAHGTARVKSGQGATLLRLKIPESLAAEAHNHFIDPNATQLVPQVFECRLELKP